MWPSYPFTFCLLALIVAFVVYFWVLKKTGILKLSAEMPQQDSLLPTSRPHHSLMGTVNTNLPVYHDNVSVIAEDNEPEYEAENWDDIEFVEVEQVSFLMREADYVVEQIQDILAHIASNPPNPEEVTSKISEVVEPYRIFFDTEYYDSINAYISLAVERDCGIQLSKAEIESLWLKGSA